MRLSKFHFPGLREQKVVLGMIDAGEHGSFVPAFGGSAGLTFGNGGHDIDFMNSNREQAKSGRVPVLLLWLFGVPLPIVGLIFILQGCHG